MVVTPFGGRVLSTFKEFVMIRFGIGFLLMMGAVGGVEQDTLGLLEGLTFALIGCILMLWAVPTMNEKEGEL
jgi:hypothetical protein